MPLVKASKDAASYSLLAKIMNLQHLLDTAIVKHVQLSPMSSISAVVWSGMEQQDASKCPFI